MKTKKLVSILITLAMVVGLLPTMSLTAFAEKQGTKEILKRSGIYAATHLFGVSVGTISGEFSDSVYKVIPDETGDYTVTFRDFTFDGVEAGQYGDCVYIENNYDIELTVNFENCKFINCGKEGTSYGGAIAVYGNGKTNVNFNNCTVLGCKAKYGGFIYINNSAAISGINESGVSTVISDCEASEYGGAVYMDSADHITLDSFVFEGNKAKYGGAVYNQGSASDSGEGIKNCRFNRNTATVSGGGVYLNDNNARISDCFFDNNTSPDYKELYYKNKAGVTNCIFGLSAGVVITESRTGDNAIKDVTIDGSSGFSDSLCKIEPEEGSTEEITVDFINVTFKNVQTGSYGDCVYIDNKSTGRLKVNFENCKFINCGKSGTSYGGAIYVYSKNNNPVDISFKNCAAINCKGDRGGFLYCNNADGNIDGTGTTVICGCEATYGGAVYMNCCNEVKNLTFASNKATDGGAIYDYCQESSNGFIYGCRFDFNTATNQGGAVFYDNNKDFYNNTYYKNNDASDFDIYMKSSIVYRYIGLSTFYSDNKVSEGDKSHIDCNENKDISTHNPNRVVLTSGLNLEPSEADGKYHINNNDDWFAFYCMVKNGSNFENEVVLESDIATIYPVGLWTGNSKTERPFKGTFDGNGKTIMLCLPNEENNNAAFNYTFGATIKNLTTYGYVKGDSGAAGIIGHAEGGVVENCTNNAGIKGADYVSGICGYAKETVFVNCTNNGNITAASNNIGGIIGRGYDVNVTNCQNSADVTGNTNIGGIVGRLTGGSFNVCKNDGNINGYQKTGGIIGCLDGEANLLNCLSYGEIKATDKYAGGIIGREGDEAEYQQSTPKAILRNCFALGSVTANSDKGAVTGHSADGSEYERCFYNKEKAPADSHGTGLSTKAMTGIEADNGYIMPDCVNDYISQNEKDKDGFLYIAFDKDGKLYFVKNDGHYHIYNTEYIWSDDNTDCTAIRYCNGCSEGTLGHLQKKETVKVKAEHHPATCIEGEYTVYTTESFKDSAFSVQTKTVNGEPAKGHDCIVEIKYNEDTKQYSLYEKCNNCDHEKTYTNDFSGYTKAECIHVSDGAYINTGYKPNEKTHVAMDVKVNGNKEYWFGVWDARYEFQVFALGNDVSGVYAGFMSEGETDGKGPILPGKTRVELDRNRVIIGGNERKLINTQWTYTLKNSLYLFTQNRKGTPYFDENDNQKFTCYGCEIYENDIVKHYYVPCVHPNGLAGLYDLVEGKFLTNVNSEGKIRGYFDSLIKIPAMKVTCTTLGYESYYMFGDKLYEDEECTREIPELTKWSGYYPAPGHDFEITDTTHKCRRCGLSENHFDTNNGGLCDICKYDLWANTFDITYLDKTLNNDNTVTTTPAVCSRARKITESDSVWGVAGDTVWYVADSTISLNNRPEVKGDVRIILKDGATLTANHGITVEKGNSLTVYAESEDENMGRLTVSTDENSGNAAIGGRKGADGNKCDNAGNGDGGAGGNNCGKVWLCGGKIVVISDGVCIGGGNGGNGSNGGLFKLGDYYWGNVGNGGNGGDGGSFDSVYFCGGEVSLKSATGACVGGGNGGNGGAGYYAGSPNGSKGNIGANGTVYFYGGTQTFTSTETACFNANSDGSYSFLKLFGTPELKAGDNAASAVTTDGYDGQKYFSVLYKEKNLLSLEVDGNSFTVTPSGENTEIGTVVVALYDSKEQSKLLDVRLFDLAKTQNLTGTFDKDGYVKAMWWSSLSDMTPTCKPDEKEMKITEP